MMEYLKDPLVLYYIAAVAMVVPMVRVLRRTGLNPFYAALLFVPMLGYILAAGAVALQKWPAAGGQK
jgi:hypothetical protein